MTTIPRLLVVDDERVDRTIVMRVAGRVGFAAEGACGPAEAEALIVSSGRFDFIVLDLSLGQEDGLAVLPILAKRNPAAIIIFVSGFDVRVLTASQRLATSLGLRVAGVLRKPLLPAALLELLLHTPTPSIVAYHHIPEVAAAPLHAAINERRIVVHFQPKVSLSTGETVGAEALARWFEADGRPITPLAFIAAAERYGLISPLTDCVLDEAIRACRIWRQDRPECQVSVNISPLLLTETDFVERLEGKLDEHGVPAGALILEITESIGVPDTPTATETLTRLRIKGIALSVDDFGTGHSGLLSLVRLPFTELKIDQAFVRDAMTDSNAAKVVRASASLGRELGLKVVAEGIETNEQAAFARDVGCDVGQGWLFGRAMTAEAFAALLQAGDRLTQVEG